MIDDDTKKAVALLDQFLTITTQLEDLSKVHALLHYAATTSIYRLDIFSDMAVGDCAKEVCDKIKDEVIEYYYGRDATPQAIVASRECGLPVRIVSKALDYSKSIVENVGVEDEACFCYLEGFTYLKIIKDDENENYRIEFLTDQGSLGSTVLFYTPLKMREEGGDAE